MRAPLEPHIIDELMRLQKKGFRRPREVPPKPTPKDHGTLRGRARQRMVAGAKVIMIEERTGIGEMAFNAGY